MSIDDAKLKMKLQLQEVDARLVNWGKWLRSDSTLMKLGYPSQAPFVFSPRKGSMIADLDAEHIEWVVSSLHLSGYPRPILHRFILLTEYALRATGATPVSERAKRVRKAFKMSFSERSYYRHLAEAKRMVMVWSGKIK